MTVLSVVFGIVIPYAAAAIFLVGMVYRVFRWMGSPVPFSIPTTCGQQKSLGWISPSYFESPYTSGGVIGRMAAEVLLFRSLFRNTRTELKSRAPKLIYSGNKYLWLGALVFHWSLLIILIRHLRLLTTPVSSPILLLQNLDGFLQIGIPTLFITDGLILIALAYLLGRRLVDARGRYISLPSDYFAVALVLGVALSGVLMRLYFRVDVEGVKELAMGMLAFHPMVPQGIGLFFYVHLLLVSSLVAYFPFSKLMHMAGIFLSPTRNLMNDSRMRRHINPWNPAVKFHTYEEYEDEFRDAMKNVGLPLDKGSR